MDNTKKFILQCEKAVKIQKDHKKEIGDYLAGSTSLWIRTGYDERDSCFEFVKYHEPTDAKLRKKIWLPRQDQLQEMVMKDKNHTNCHFLLDDFDKWRRPNPIYSMEQLWLAFVMSEKYQKQWSGTDWINKE